MKPRSLRITYLQVDFLKFYNIYSPMSMHITIYAIRVIPIFRKKRAAPWATPVLIYVRLSYWM